MPLYIVPRTRAWLSEEELDAAADCLPAVLDHMDGGDVRFIRSYIVREEDGTFGAFCVYEATSPEAILAHSEWALLPTDAIKPIHETVVRAPDPEPIRAA
jgi:Nickel responsive protein SCO4226-like